jgi:hypothetical protein
MKECAAVDSTSDMVTGEVKYLSMINGYSL